MGMEKIEKKEEINILEIDHKLINIRRLIHKT